MYTTSLNIKKFYFSWEREFLCLRDFQKNNSDFVLCSINVLAFMTYRKYVYYAQEKEPFQHSLGQYSSLYG
jgi:hypothetical protein